MDSALVLHGGGAASAHTRRIADAIVTELHARGESPRLVDLDAITLAPCLGDFDCWAKSPGTCRTHDAGREIARAVHDAGRLVLVGPVAFGGHGHVAKRALDRVLCLVLPTFARRAGLTHHEARYERYPSLYAAGWMPERDVLDARVFRQVIEANAINFFAPEWAAAVIEGDLDSEQLAARARAMLTAEHATGSETGPPRLLTQDLLAAALPDDAARAARFAAKPRVAVLIGSAKPKGQSTSESLAQGLSSSLLAAGAEVETVRASAFVHDGEASRRAAEALANADVFVLASPVYIDTLPSLAMKALELVASARSDARAPARFCLLTNCGFPESAHTRLAVAVARSFARHAGLVWAGALALGSGGVIDGRPLDEVGGVVRHLVSALDASGAALASGGVLPEDAIRTFTRPLIPAGLYRMLGEWGWKRLARSKGNVEPLDARPLDA